MYEFSFDAWSDRERDMVVGLGLSANPWTNVQELVNFDTERKTFTFWLSSATFSGSTCRVFFDLGGNVGLVNIDNVSLKEITCPNPSFTTSDATYDGVSFTWNTNPEIDSYTVEISYDLFTPGDGTATSYVFSDSEPQPYVITGLEDGAKYFISIKSNCGDSYSAPIGPNYLFTLWDEVVDCPEVITPPYFNDFGKEAPFGWSSVPMDKPRAEFLECNTLIDADAEQITESSDNWGLFADNFSSGVDNVFAISFSFDLNQSVGLNVDNYVAKGPIDLTNASSAELKWKVRSYSQDYYQENYTVYISDTDEVSDILASTTNFNETLTSSDVGQWSQKSLDLSSDVGKLVYVVFRHHDSYDHYFIGLDDIEITTETLGNKEFNINLSYYFNRATKSLELEALSHIKEVSIYDMNGRLINLETPDTLKSNIDFNDIPKGLYIVKAKTDQGFKSIKVLNQ